MKKFLLLVVLFIFENSFCFSKVRKKKCRDDIRFIINQTSYLIKINTAESTNESCVLPGKKGYVYGKDTVFCIYYKDLSRDDTCFCSGQSIAIPKNKNVIRYGLFEEKEGKFGLYEAVRYMR